MNHALVIGISTYPAPIPELPGVAADVREMGKLLRSENGKFKDQDVLVLADHEASQSRILSELKRVFGSSAADETLFVYLAGHGSVTASDRTFYFIAHDSDGSNLPTTGVPLIQIKELFERCKSRRVLLWLDFCHSGGIIPRSMEATISEERQAIERTLKIIQGEGKIIFAACTPEQYAYEDPSIGHGLFTASLLRGLKGEAASGGEVTANSLFDFIDRQIGSTRQRPMYLGNMTGRVVLMHYGPLPAPVLTKKAVSEDSAGSNVVVDSSGAWVLLGNQFFETKSVRHIKDGAVILEIPSHRAETDAAVGRLKPDQFGRSQTIAFAYRNDGMLVRVSEVEGASTGEEQLWTVKLTPEKSGYGAGFMEASLQINQRRLTPDDIAKMRVGRILLNDPPPQVQQRGGFTEDSMVESSIRGMNSPVTVDQCVVRELYKTHGTEPKVFLQLARLSSIYLLKASSTVAEVLELSLGPIKASAVHVKFRGRRPQQYTSVEAAIIAVDGECPLT